VEADEIAKRRRQRMIHIAITAAAYDAICSTLPEYAPQSESAVNRRILRDDKT
jgi:hypothetical protein